MMLWCILLLLISSLLLSMVNGITVNPRGDLVADNDNTINFGPGPFRLSLSPGDKVRMVTPGAFSSCGIGACVVFSYAARDKFDDCEDGVNRGNSLLFTIPLSSSPGDSFFFGTLSQNSCRDLNAKLEIIVISPATNNNDKNNDTSGKDENGGEVLPGGTLAGILIGTGLVCGAVFYVASRKRDFLKEKFTRKNVTSLSSNSFQPPMKISHMKLDNTPIPSSISSSSSSERYRIPESKSHQEPDYQDEVHNLSNRIEFTKLFQPLAAIPEHRSLVERMSSSAKKILYSSIRSSSNSSRYSSDSNMDNTLEGKIYRFYSVNDPQKVEAIESFLAEWRHSIRQKEGYDAFNEALRKRYGKDLSSLSAMSSDLEAIVEESEPVPQKTQQPKKNRFTWITKPDI